MPFEVWQRIRNLLPPVQGFHFLSAIQTLDSKNRSVIIARERGFFASQLSRGDQKNSDGVFVDCRHERRIEVRHHATAAMDQWNRRFSTNQIPGPPAALSPVACTRFATRKDSLRCPEMRQRSCLYLPPFLPPSPSTSGFSHEASSSRLAHSFSMMDFLQVRNTTGTNDCC